MGCVHLRAMEVIITIKIDGNLWRFFSPILSMILGDFMPVLMNLIQLLSASGGRIFTVTSVGILPKWVTVVSHFIECLRPTW